MRALCISLGHRAGICYVSVMRQSFVIEPARFISSLALDHPSLHGLDDTETVLDWTRLEALVGKSCASTIDRPSYPFLTLFSSLFLGIWYKLSDEHFVASPARDLLFWRLCRLELSGDIIAPRIPGQSFLETHYSRFGSLPYCNTRNLHQFPRRLTDGGREDGR